MIEVDLYFPHPSLIHVTFMVMKSSQPNCAAIRHLHEVMNSVDCVDKVSFIFCNDNHKQVSIETTSNFDDEVINKVKQLINVFIDRIDGYDIELVIDTLGTTSSTTFQVVDHENEEPFSPELVDRIFKQYTDREEVSTDRFCKVGDIAIDLNDVSAVNMMNRAYGISRHYTIGAIINGKWETIEACDWVIDGKFYDNDKSFTLAFYKRWKAYKENVSDV